MDTETQDATIAETAEACLLSFNKCLELFAVLPPQQQSAVEDQLGRFSIWTANIGVFSHYRASLDYRLRGVADVQRLVSGLLRTLNEHIHECKKLAMTFLSKVRSNFYRGRFITSGLFRSSRRNHQPC